jgi:hypothetical protein
MIVYKYRKELGIINELVNRPVADIEILGKDREWYWVTTYIDSGADISIIPYSLGLSMGFEIKKDEIIELTGAGGREIPTLIIKTKIKFSQKIIRDAEIGWALIETVPILLGRHTIFETFNITFKEKEGLIIFEPID